MCLRPGSPSWGCQSCVTLGAGAQEGPGTAEQSVGQCPCVTPSCRHPVPALRAVIAAVLGQGGARGRVWEPAEMFLCCLALSGAATSPRCLSGPTRVTHTLNINVAAHFPPWQRWELSSCMELGTLCTASEHCISTCSQPGRGCSALGLGKNLPALHFMVLWIHHEMGALFLLVFHWSPFSQSIHFFCHK